MDITEKIKTFEDALKATGETQSSFDARTVNDSTDEIAYKKIKVIAIALNDGWKPNWKNDDEYKYYPWFDFEDDGGLGLSCLDYDRDFSTSAVGSRLCYKTRGLAEYAGKQFASIYAAMMVIQEK